jgi:uncharacterized membrane protein SpoIIM required for sporulation/ABC-type transport system involved in multi-copper enzyme maturation permease subunit
MAVSALPRVDRSWWSGVWMLTRRELRDTLRDWRMVVPIVLLTLVFPVIMTLTASAAQNFVNRFNTPLIGERLIPFLLMIVGFFPMSFSLVIALEAFVGERERKSLEPLLATPLTDGQLYLGKMLASLVPALSAAYLGIGVYLLGLFIFRNYTPQPILLAQILALTTIEGLVMVSGAVVVSSRATSVRAANLLASFIIIPMALLVQAESVIMFWAIYDALWGIVLGLIVVDAILVRMGMSLFNREELLGREIDQLSLRGTLAKFKRWWAISEVGVAPQRLSIGRLYRQHIPAALNRLRGAMLAVLAALVMISVAGWLLAGRFPLPQGLINFDDLRAEAFDGSALMGLLPSFTWHAVLWNNVRSLLLGGVLGVFSFGALALVLLMAPIGIVAFAAAQVAASSLSPVVFLLAFIVPHGLFELPAAVIATAATLRLGAALVHRPINQLTVGENWLLALVDFVKLFVFVVVPLLLIASVVEVQLTPKIICLIYGCH